MDNMECAIRIDPCFVIWMFHVTPMEIQTLLVLLVGFVLDFLETYPYRGWRLAAL